MRIARSDREPPGLGVIDLMPIVEAMPAVPYALQVPNDKRREELRRGGFRQAHSGSGRELPRRRRARTGDRRSEMTHILVINGPNLNLLGERESEVYGQQTLADIVSALRSFAEDRDVELSDLQSNSEGELVSAIHNAREFVDGIILNAGAYPLQHRRVGRRDSRSSAPCGRDPPSPTSTPGSHSGTSRCWHRCAWVSVAGLGQPQLLRRLGCSPATPRPIVDLKRRHPVKPM